MNALRPEPEERPPPMSVPAVSAARGNFLCVMCWIPYAVAEMAIIFQHRIGWGICSACAAKHGIEPIPERVLSGKSGTPGVDV